MWFPRLCRICLLLTPSADTVLGDLSVERGRDTKTSAVPRWPSRSRHCWKGIRDLPVPQSCLYNIDTDQELWGFVEGEITGGLWEGIIQKWSLIGLWRLGRTPAVRGGSRLAASYPPCFKASAAHFREVTDCNSALIMPFAGSETLNTFCCL